MMNHLSQIAQALPEHDLDAILITSEAGERYALGFHGEGVVLVTRKGPTTPPTAGIWSRPSSR